jgi:hypothetical protein
MKIKVKGRDTVLASHTKSTAKSAAVLAAGDCKYSGLVKSHWPSHTSVQNIR